MKYNTRLVEEEIKLYFKIKYKNLIEVRRQEIMYPYKETDENIGGGKSNKKVSAVENAVVKIANDKVIKYYSSILEDINMVYNKFSYSDQDILKVIYLYGEDELHGRYSDKQTAEKTGMLLQEVKKLRTKFINEVAEVRGHYKYW